MSRLYNTFNFVGELAISNDESRLYDKKSFKSGWDRHKVVVGIKENELNSEFLTIEGFHSEKHPVYVYGLTKGLHGQKRESIRINWEDRLKEDIVDEMAGFSKYIVDLEEDQDVKEEYMKIYYKIISLENREDPSEEDLEKLKKYKEEFKEKSKNRHEFLHPYDMVMFLKEVLPTYKDKKFRATGNVELSEYQGNIYTNYVPKLLEIVPSDYANELKSTLNIFFNKDSIDESVEDEVEDEDEKYIIDKTNNNNFDDSIKKHNVNKKNKPTKLKPYKNLTELPQTGELFNRYQVIIGLILVILGIIIRVFQI